MSTANLNNANTTSNKAKHQKFYQSDLVSNALKQSPSIYSMESNRSAKSNAFGFKIVKVEQHQKNSNSKSKPKSPERYSGKLDCKVLKNISGCDSK